MSYFGPSRTSPYVTFKQPGSGIYYIKLEEAIAYIASCYNPDSPLYRFNHVFYRHASPEQLRQLQKPPNCSEELWNYYLRTNPSPQTHMPEVAKGFAGLEARLQTQEVQMEKIKQFSASVAVFIEQKNSFYRAEIQSRIENCRRVQEKLKIKMISVFVRLMIGRNKYGPLSAGEEEIAEKIRVFRRDCDVNGVRSRLGNIQTALMAGDRRNVVLDWKGVDENDEKFRHLADQLGSFTEVITKMGDALTRLNRQQ